MIDTALLVKNLVNTGIFSILGLAILCLGFMVIDWLTPYDLWKEINEKENVALAIIVGAFSLGVSIIIAAALHG
ncbi:MAG: DUF350 domain-containing protein [Proteobacteria bacterium]|nr:DUF350 domain-containing protein [Pseudomonadota bacterium]